MKGGGSSNPLVGKYVAASTADFIALHKQYGMGFEYGGKVSAILGKVMQPPPF